MLLYGTALEDDVLALDEPQITQTSYERTVKRLTVKLG